MNEPLVSVKMITYNHAPYIARAIEGVLQQKTEFPFELVIGEDCSTDGTREIVSEYQKRFPEIIRVVTSETNVGMIRNGYRTEKACTGKYIAWCEGDDYWHNPHKLQKQVEYMESHPECGLVHSDYDRFFPETGKVTKNFNRFVDNKPPDNLDICSILRGGKYLYILTCTVMARKAILFDIIDADSALYETPTFLIGDTPRWAEIAYRSKTHYMDESLATYTVMDESASKSKDPIRVVKFGMSIHELFLYLVDKYNLPESECRYHTEKWCTYALELAYRTSDKALASQVRRRKQAWSTKDQLLYLGATNNLFNVALRTAQALKRKLSGDS